MPKTNQTNLLWILKKQPIFFEKSEKTVIFRTFDNEQILPPQPSSKYTSVIAMSYRFLFLSEIRLEIKFSEISELCDVGSNQVG